MLIDHERREGASRSASAKRLGEQRALAEGGVLRWDGRRPDAPRILERKPRESSSGNASVCWTRSGNSVFIEGYLFDRESGGRVDAAVVARDYESSGEEELLRRLRGAFLLSLWHGADERLSIARDPLGLHSCYYYWNERLLLVSSSLDALLAQAEVGSAFHLPGLAEHLQACRVHVQIAETLYKEVKRLLPGHRLVLQAGRVDVVRYWDPLPPGFSWATDEELATFSPRLERAVARCLAAGADSIALSGGFDSVSIATLAHAQRQEKPPLQAISLRFNRASCDESETQQQVARALGMPQILKSVEELSEPARMMSGALALSGGSPTPVLSVWQSLYTGLLEAARSLGLRHLLLGTGGDDLFNVDVAYAADQWSRLELRGLWRLLRCYQRTSPFPAPRVARFLLWESVVLPWTKRAVRRALRRLSPDRAESLRRLRARRALPDWIAGGNRDLVDALEARRLACEGDPLDETDGAYVDALRRLVLSPLRMTEQEQGFAWASRLDQVFLYPYWDRDLVELVLRIHPEHLVRGGWAKAPLRRLVASRLPNVTMRSKKVDFTKALDDILRPGGEAAWTALGDPDMLTDLGLVDGARVRAHVTEYLAGRSSDWMSFWLIVSTEAWLRARSVEAPGFQKCNFEEVLP